jgi:hypothetical protein
MPVFLDELGWRSKSLSEEEAEVGPVVMAEVASCFQDSAREA